jgi:hypothetical protein
MGRIEQEAIGPLNLYNIHDTVSAPIEATCHEGTALREGFCTRRTGWDWA